MNFRYAHLADLHLGSWRDPVLRDASTRAFVNAMDECIAQNVDFILFAGDLFNTSLPSLDTLKTVTGKLKEVQLKGIPLYAIAGSHDFSPSGKTMLDVLEKAGLLVNVCKGYVHQETKELHLKITTDPKTNAKITGLLGRKGMLDRSYYENLHRRDLEQEPGYKIFMFHTALTELKPKHLELLEAQPLSFLPKNFNYYAGGHIHHPTKLDQEGYGTLTYPGALFPNNFAELEKYSHGGYYLITVQDSQQDIHWQPLQVLEHCHLAVNCNHKSADSIAAEITNHFQGLNVQQAIITIRLFGTMTRGKVSEINFKEITEQLTARGAAVILKNTAKLNSEEFFEIKMPSYGAAEILEEEIIKEHLQQIKLFNIETELNVTKLLLATLYTSKKEGETSTDFQKRIETEMSRILNI